MIIFCRIRLIAPQARLIVRSHLSYTRYNATLLTTISHNPIFTPYRKRQLAYQTNNNIFRIDFRHIVTSKTSRRKIFIIYHLEEKCLVLFSCYFFGFACRPLIGRCAFLIGWLFCLLAICLIGTCLWHCWQKTHPVIIAHWNNHHASSI